MRDYELTVLFHPDLEMNLEPALEKVQTILTQNGAKIKKAENDGKKRLAYPVERQEYGLFYFFEIDLPPSAPAKIENALKLADEVMRVLLVRAEERKTKDSQSENNTNHEEEE